jgi:hypothetical protein
MANQPASTRFRHVSFLTPRFSSIKTPAPKWTVLLQQDSWRKKALKHSIDALLSNSPFPDQDVVVDHTGHFLIMSTIAVAAAV